MGVGSIIILLTAGQLRIIFDRRNAQQAVGTGPADQHPGPQSTRSGQHPLPFPGLYCPPTPRHLPLQEGHELPMRSPDGAPDLLQGLRQELTRSHLQRHQKLLFQADRRKQLGRPNQKGIKVQKLLSARIPH